MPRAARSIEIAAAPAQVMAVLTDFAAYPRFLPDLHEVTVLRAEADAWEVRFTLQVIRRLSYTLQLTRPDPLRLTWTLLEGAFRSNDGSWTLEPLQGGQATRASYQIDVQLGLYVPGNIIHSLVDTGLPQTLARFRDETERRARPETAPGGG